MNTCETRGTGWLICIWAVCNAATNCTQGVCISAKATTVRDSIFPYLGDGAAEAAAAAHDAADEAQRAPRHKGHDAVHGAAGPLRHQPRVGQAHCMWETSCCLHVGNVMLFHLKKTTMHVRPWHACMQVRDLPAK